MPPKQFISFTIDSEEYAVDVMVIHEIKGWADTTELPDQPPHMAGVIDLRGVIVPILDLRARLGGGVTCPTARHVMIILNVNGRPAGILADGVSDILTADEAEIQPVPQIHTHADHGVVRGMLSHGGKLIAVLEPEHVFQSESPSMQESFS